MSLKSKKESFRIFLFGPPEAGERQENILDSMKKKNSGCPFF
jgi:hypothetical protein